MKIDYVVALDLGQTADYSAMVVIEVAKSDATTFACRGLKRWPPGTAYPTVLKEVEPILTKAPLRDATLLLDCTLLGRPIYELFRRAALPVGLVPVLITNGQGESLSKGWHHVAKVVLISGVQVLLQQRRLQFAQEMAEVPALVKELQNYRLKPAKVNENELIDPRESEHDDMVLALALACWWGERKKPMARAW